MRDSIPMARGAVLDGFQATARSCGLDPDVLLRKARISPDLLLDADQKVPTASIVNLLESASLASGNPSFGLLMAQARKVSVLGPVALVMREQPDLRCALGRLTQLGWAQAEGLESVLEDDGETAILSFSLAADQPRPATQTIELALAAIVRLLRHFIDPTWSPQMLTFSHRRPVETSLYARYLGVAPIFRMERNSIVMLTADLDRPIAHADQAFGRQLERYVESIAQRRGATRREQVSEAIRRMMPTGQCCAARIADLFGADRRTLHRWLKAEGGSFSQLLEENRTALCAQYRSEHSHSLTEISELLGFSSLSAYSRWRRRRKPQRPGKDSSEGAK